jgi:hypothetical protein
LTIWAERLALGLFRGGRHRRLRRENPQSSIAISTRQ